LKRRIPGSIALVSCLFASSAAAQTPPGPVVELAPEDAAAAPKPKPLISFGSGRPPEGEEI
jgi:hypothetical protein